MLSYCSVTLTLSERTRLLVVWLISNAALAISVASLNGLNDTTAHVKACFPGGNLEGDATKVDTHCVATALNESSDRLHQKQGVSCLVCVTPMNGALKLLVMASGTLKAFSGRPLG